MPSASARNRPATDDEPATVGATPVATPAATPSAATPPADPDALAIGILVGVLLGEGHFGGDGVRAQVTLRMHARHEGLFRWLERTFPGGRLYGPYHHGGRHYFQWMVRGRYLAEVIAPLVDAHLRAIDPYVAERFDEMCARYRIVPDARATRP